MGMAGEMMSRYLFEFLSNRISFAFIMLYLLLFLELRYNWLMSALTVVFAYLSEFLLGYMCYFTDFGKSHQMFFTAVSILLIQGVAFLLDSYRDFRTVFTAVSGSSFIVLGTALGTVTFLYTRDAAIGLAVVALVQCLIMAGLVLAVRKPYLETMKQPGRYWKVLWIIPSAFFAINYSAQTWPSDLIETPSNAFTCIVSSLTMMICYAMLFQLFDMWRKEQKLAEDNRFLDAYAQGLRHEMETVRMAEERTAYWRHDMRHMFRLLAAFAREGESEKCLELLRDMDERIVETRAVHYCDNVTLNGVLSGCAAIAQRENVKYTCQADAPAQLCQTNEFALAAVLSNLVENAINAASKAEGEHWVSVHILPVKGQLRLEVRNTYAGEITISPQTGLPQTTQGEKHGFGLQSVQAFCERYKAVFHYTTEADHVFRVTLLTDQ